MCSQGSPHRDTSLYSYGRGPARCLSSLTGNAKAKPWDKQLWNPRLSRINTCRSHRSHRKTHQGRAGASGAQRSMICQETLLPPHQCLRHLCARQHRHDAAHPHFAHPSPQLPERCVGHRGRGTARLTSSPFLPPSAAPASRCSILCYTNALFLTTMQSVLSYLFHIPLLLLRIPCPYYASSHHEEQVTTGNPIERTFFINN